MELNLGKWLPDCPSRNSRLALVMGALLAATLTPARATDWSQYLGPNHNDTTPDTLATNWTSHPPKLLWKIPTPDGFSTFSIVGPRAYTLVTREIGGVKKEVCVALNANTGKELWASPLDLAKYTPGGDSGTPNNQGGDGPRSTPSVANGRVFVYDAHANLYCFDAATGKAIWRKDIVHEFGGRLCPWQSAASPVLAGDRLFICTGARNKSLMALRQKDGQVLWATQSDGMTQATPIIATIHGVRQIIFFTQKGLVATTLDKGTVLWRFPFRFSVSTAASPVVSGDIVYCSAGYGVGTAAARITKQGDTWSAHQIWKISGAKRANDFANHWSTPIIKGGYVYGIFGVKEYGKAPLKCLDLATGKQMWSQTGFGPGGLVQEGNLLVVLSDRGEVVLVDPQPTGYKELARFKAIQGKCWNHPIVCNGRIYARSTKQGACFQIGQ